MGSGQRSEPEANRLVDWLLFNGIVVDELKQAYTFDGVTYPAGSYVVLHEPGPPGSRRHRPRHRRRHLRGHQHPLRAAGCVEPRLPVGCRRGTGAAGRDLHPAHQPDPQGQPPARRRRTGHGERIRPGDRLADGGAHPQRAHGRRPHGRAGAGAVHGGERRSPARPGARSSPPTRRPRSGWPRSAARTTCGSTGSAASHRRPSRSTASRGSWCSPAPSTRTCGRCRTSASRPTSCRRRQLNAAAAGPAAELRRHLEHRRLPGNAANPTARRGCRPSSPPAAATSVPGPTVRTSSTTGALVTGLTAATRVR